MGLQKDFRDAVKRVQPASTREGFTTVPTTKWEEVPSFSRTISKPVVKLSTSQSTVYFLKQYCIASQLGALEAVRKELEISICKPISHPKVFKAFGPSPAPTALGREKRGEREGKRGVGLGGVTGERGWLRSNLCALRVHLAMLAMLVSI